MVYSDIIKSDLSVEDIKDIIQDINNGKKQYRKFANEENMKYQNGRYTTIWDYAFTNIENSFKNKTGFTCYSIERCALWKFAAIYKEDTDILYLISKEKRFKELQKDNNPYHYFKIFNSKNCSLHKSRPKQISFFQNLEASEINNEYIDADLEKMIGNIKDKVRNCVNILFRENSYGICAISANVATQDLDIIATEDWSKYITADIEEINDTSSTIVEHKETKLPEIPLTIKKDKMKNKELMDGEIKVKNIKQKKSK